jgi:hypothetical protein
MANEMQFRAATRIIATRGVQEYRETIPAVVGPGDHVLEVAANGVRRPPSWPATRPT